MSASEIQAERQAAMPRTPSKPANEPRKPMIGSSSTWGQAELDRFEVKLGDAVASKLIPEKFFNFIPSEESSERISHPISA